MWHKELENCCLGPQKADELTRGGKDSATSCHGSDDDDHDNNT